MKAFVITGGFFVISAVAIVSIVAPKAMVPTVFAKEQETAKVKPPSAESTAARVDKLFAEWNRADSPGCSLGVSKNGVVVYERGYGMANLESGTPLTPASVLAAASISKQFTAMSVLLLAQRGKLSLDDEVQKYIPEWAGHSEWVNHGSRITIRHLLTHTSGVRDGFTLHELNAARDDVFDNDVMVKILARTRGLNFKPGSEFQYNNSAYALLGSIVKRVSGESLPAFAEANIFKPLGMTHTLFQDDPTLIVPNRAWGYHRDASGLHVSLHAYLNHIVGNTGVFTTARDLLLWEQNFADPRVGDKALIATMQTPVIGTGWADGSSYGYGLEIAEYRGLRMIGHGGGDGGVAAYVGRYPDQGFAVALLCNLVNIGENLGVAGLTRRVADIYLSDVFPKTPAGNATAAPASVTLSAEQLASKVGLYRDPVSENVGRIFVHDGKLMVRGDTDEGEGLELTPISENQFILPGTAFAIEFLPAATGRPQQIRVTGNGPKPGVSQKLDAFTPSSADLRAFAGEYTSPEVEGTYTLMARDGSLGIQIPGRTEFIVRPIFKDAFGGGVVGVVKFSRDRDGAVTGFTAHSDGVRRLRFDRVKR